MKILKRILLVIALLIVILLVAALFIKKEYTVQREITINKPKQEVFEFIKMSRNQEKYNKWWMMDPAKKLTFTGTDGTIGFTSAWDSKQSDVGKGEEEIKKITEGESVDHEVRFEKPFEGVAQTHMSTEAAGTQTKVKWVFSGKSNYPMNLMNLFIDGMLGKDMQKSLDNLKTVLEK